MPVASWLARFAARSLLFAVWVSGNVYGASWVPEAASMRPWSMKHIKQQAISRQKYEVGSRKHGQEHQKTGIRMEESSINTHSPVASWLARSMSRKNITSNSKQHEGHIKQTAGTTHQANCRKDTSRRRNPLLLEFTKLPLLLSDVPLSTFVPLGSEKQR